MQLGMIGLGRMGANMVRRLIRNGHTCVVYDRSAESVKQLTGEGATGSDSLDGPLHDIPNATPFLFDGDSLERAVAVIRRLVSR